MRSCLVSANKARMDRLPLRTQVIPSQAKRHILHIEDDPEVAESIAALLETNGGIDSYAEDSCDLGYSDHPFSVEFPFDGFNASTGFDTAHVEALAFTFNGISKVGGVGYAVASIELSNSKAPGAIVCKVPEQSVQAR